MNITARTITFNNLPYVVTEDEQKVYFREVSNRVNKAHFSFSKNKSDNDEAEYGLKTFWTEIFS